MATPRREPGRCEWAGTDPAMVAYHDDEWGVAEHDDHRLFELLTLEGAQAGLSWSTILAKRAGYRRAFVGFDPTRVADLPAATEESNAMSKELKRRGFRFVGPTTVYAFMQAAGFVNDHTRDCFRWRELGGNA